MKDPNFFQPQRFESLNGKMEAIFMFDDKL